MAAVFRLGDDGVDCFGVEAAQMSRLEVIQAATFGKEGIEG